MRLIKADQFFERYFDPESMPSESTRARWLANGTVPARKLGGQWFVDEHAWLAGEDPLVERVLAGQG